MNKSKAPAKQSQQAPAERAQAKPTLESWAEISEAEVRDDEKAALAAPGIPRAPTVALSHRVRTAFTAAGKGGGVARIRMVTSADIQCSAGGTVYFSADVYTDVVQLDPDWNSLIAVFDQYRVLTIEAIVVPFAASKTGVTAAINGEPKSYVIAYDPTDDTTPTSENTTWAMGTARIGSFSDPKPARYFWKVAAQQPFWYNTASNTNPLLPATGVKFASDGNMGNGVIVGKIYWSAIAEWRMRK